MGTFAIWSEGYAATGERSDATFHGEFQASSFDEAVELFLKTRETTDWPNIREYYSVREQEGKKVHSIWACRLFDNEQDARKSFG